MHTHDARTWTERLLAAIESCVSEIPSSSKSEPSTHAGIVRSALACERRDPTPSAATTHHNNIWNACIKQTYITVKTTMRKENMEPSINQQKDTDDFVVDGSTPTWKEAPVVAVVAPVTTTTTMKRDHHGHNIHDATHNDDGSTAMKKRSRIGTKDSEHPPPVSAAAASVSPLTEEDTDILDFARTMELNVGDRIQVQWEVDLHDNAEEDYEGEEEEEEEENEDRGNEPTTEVEPSTVPESTTTTTHIHWWGATLLEHDGRTDDHVAIRTLLYDPYPEGGFPEPSREDVIFMGPNVLLSYPSQDELNYRILTTDGSEVSYIISNDQDIEDLVDTILSNALQNTSCTFQLLDRSQQIKVADKIATKKERLIQLIQEHMREHNNGPQELAASGTVQRNRTVTAQDALLLLARAMQSD